MPEVKDAAAQLNALAKWCHEANTKWWLDLRKPCLTCLDFTKPHPQCSTCHGHGYYTKERNVGELLMLCVSELAEAMEGDRKGLQDDKLPHRKMFEVELADCFIRLFDLCAGKGLDIGGAFVSKMEFNKNREDHKIEHRLGDGGKKY